MISAIFSMPSICLPSGQSLTFVVRRSRRSRKVTLRLYADGVLRVAAPNRTSDAAIETLIIQSSEWISKSMQIQAAKSRPAVNLSYLNNSLHLYRGELVRLQWQDSPQDPQLQGETLAVSAQSEHEAGQELRRFYKQQSELVFNQRMSYWCDQIGWLDRTPAMSVKRMTSRWGSCSHKGRISLNLHLIKAPHFVLDEVIVHEICHLKEMNHGARFYVLMDDILPSWRRSRAWIKENHGQLLADHSLWQ